MTLRRLAPWALLVVVAGVALAVAARPAAEDRTVAGRVASITEGLRCPTCQGLSVADSPSSTARAITEDVRRMVEAGESDDAVKAVYVERYGEWILLRPRSSGLGVLVWALPLAALAAAVAGLVVAFRRWGRVPRLHASDDDRRLVERARGEPGEAP